MSIVEIYALQLLFLCFSNLITLDFLLFRLLVVLTVGKATTLGSMLNRRAGNIFLYILITFLSFVSHSFSLVYFLTLVVISPKAVGLWIKITQ